MKIIKLTKENPTSDIIYTEDGKIILDVVIGKKTIKDGVIFLYLFSRRRKKNVKVELSKTRKTFEFDITGFNKFRFESLFGAIIHYNLYPSSQRCS